jgi:phosphoserine phosphatase
VNLSLFDLGGTLIWATHPVASNPGEALAAIARERGWPVMNLYNDRPEQAP